MKPQCIDAVNQAVSRTMTDAEIKGIEERIVRHMRQNAARDPQAALAMTAEQRFTEAAKSAAEEFQIAGQEGAARRLAGTRKRQNRAAPCPVRRRQNGRLARVVVFHADGKGNFLSIESQAKAIERDALRQMIGTMEATNAKFFFGLFENRDGVRALVKELLRPPG